MPLAQDAQGLLFMLRQKVAVHSAFLALFKFIDESPNGRFGWLALGEGAIRGVTYDRQLALWQQKLRESISLETQVDWIHEIANLGETLEGISANGVISRQASLSLVIALKVLDFGFRGVHPGEVRDAVDGAGYIALRTRVRLGLPLFESEGRQVFPRPRRLAQPEVRGQGRLNELLESLVVVPRSTLLQVINLTAFSVDSPGPDGFKSIGIIPTINTHKELEWAKEPGDRYSVAEKVDSRMAIQVRVGEALSRLLDEGAELILMPELVSSLGLSEFVANEVGRRRRAGLHTPHLIVAGTFMARDGERVRNRAHIYDREGELVWMQDKLHAYRFTSHEQQRAKYPLGDKDVVDRIEAIDIEPRTLYIVDLSSTQRISVLTCEDFGQPEPHRDVLAEIMATTILVPIMGGAREQPGGDWIHDAALTYVRHPGATSVMANSGALIGPDGAGTQENFCQIVAAPQVRPDWTCLMNSADEPLAWLARLGRVV